MASNDESVSIYFVVLAAVVLFFVWDTNWFGRVWYSRANHVNYADTLVTLKPHDCEFMSAPVGRKNCHYQAKVIVMTGAWLIGSRLRTEVAAILSTGHVPI